MKKTRSGFQRTFSNARGRWAAIGPYYAMFPLEFAFEVVKNYSKPGDLILDPFAGRGSSIYAAATQQRHGIGFEINPVGWVYSGAKLSPATSENVKRRFLHIAKLAPNYESIAKELPEFFHWCYAENVRMFLCASRENLRWRSNKTDRTLMALLLVYLHGKLGQTLSNQMNQTKSMGPLYSIRWWQKNDFKPPELDIIDFFLPKIEWRYKKGIPTVTKSQIYLGDTTEIFENRYANFRKHTDKKVSLLFTSPPYRGVTNYHKDQWLRLWLLGESDSPLGVSEIHKGRFESRDSYQALLLSVFEKAAEVMVEKGIIYVRTSNRPFTYETTLSLLKECFPSAHLEIRSAPAPKKTQTNLIGNKSSLSAESDFVLTLKG